MKFSRNVCIASGLAALAAVVGAVLLLRRDNQPLHEDAASGAPAFGFVDIAQRAGVDFTMDFLPGEQGEHFKINLYDHGAGVAVGDYNGDGRDDLYFLNQLGPNALFENLGDGKFRDATESAGGLGLDDRVSVGATFSDYDNDGDQDLYVTSTRAGNVLFQNDGKGVFHDVTEAAGLTLVAHSQTAAFFDADSDGDLDLLTTNTARWTTEDREENDHYYIGRANLLELVQAPLEYNVFYRNEGQGKFIDATAAAGLKGRGWGGDVAIADFDDDGDLDVYLASMFFPDQLMFNDGQGVFADGTKDALGKTSWGSIGAKSFDYDRDGRLDLLVVDMHSDMWTPFDMAPDKVEERRKYRYMSGGKAETPENLAAEQEQATRLGLNYEEVRFGNSLFKNLGAGKFTETSDGAGIETFWPWGIATGDFDNDGFEDVFLPTGMGYPYFYWPNRLMMNRGNGAFAEQSVEQGVAPPAVEKFLPEKIGGQNAPRSSRCAVTLDFDNDGRLDLVVGNFNDAPFVYHNQFPRRHYAAFKLTGTKSNRDAIGAIVTLHCGGDRLVRQVHAAGGYLSHSSKTLHFGLGDRTAIDRCEIAWPSGRRQTIEQPKIDALHVIEEPNDDVAIAR